jgi:hypothetical protein
MPALPASIGVYYYSLDGAMVISRFLRVHKRPKRTYAKVMGQKYVLTLFDAPLAPGCCATQDFRTRGSTRACARMRTAHGRALGETASRALKH